MDGDPFTSDLRASAGAEAGRLRQVVDALESRLAAARAERELVSQWSPEQIEDLRQGMRMPRFADVEELERQHAEARAQLDAVEALRRGLGGA